MAPIRAGDTRHESEPVGSTDAEASRAGILNVKRKIKIIRKFVEVLIDFSCHNSTLLTSPMDPSHHSGQFRTSTRS